MAVSGKTAAPFEIPYLEESDIPDMGAGDKAIAERLAELLAAIEPTQITAAFQELLVPAGSLLATARSTAPSGYLLCEGQAISRSTYKALFEAIGTAYGEGDKSSTFNVPDLRGRVPVGVDGAANRLSANDTLGKAAGEEKHALTEAEMPSHSHRAYGTTQTFFSAGSGTVQNPSEMNNYPGGAFSVVTSPTGGNGAHNNMQPYQVVNYMIKT